MKQPVQSLPQYFWKVVEGFIEPDGFHQHGVSRDRQGKTTMYNIHHINPEMVHVTMVSQTIVATTLELVYGLDRFVLPGQPAELTDIVTAAWWKRGRGWKFGVIPYRPPPDKLVLPWDWNNRFWNDIMRSELFRCWSNREKILADARQGP
jgi:hypothetical protein